MARLASLRRLDRSRSWLFAIARNAVTDHFRQLRRTEPLEAAEHEERLWASSLAAEVEQREEYRRLRRYLANLDAREREIIGLKFVARLTNREVAPVLGLTEANVAQVLHRALAKVRCLYDQEEIG